MNQHLTDSRLANLGAQTIVTALRGLRAEFNTVTRRAQARFETRDWAGMQEDAAERLALYRKVVGRLEEEIRDLLGERLGDKLLWTGLKAVYSGLIAESNDWDVAETFFNSLTRRIFATVGVDRRIEFVDTDFESPPNPPREPVFRTYERADSTAALIEQILGDQTFLVGFDDLPRDARLGAEAIEAHLRKIGGLRHVERAELLRPVFYRGQGAYLVGRIYSGPQVSPVVLALLHGERGITLDAVLLDEDDVSILFSFTRSHFHVDVKRPYDFVRFLKSIMPPKRVAELCISIGLNKHGKTELYRDLLHHIATSDDRFEVAAGKPGMVMIVFYMPGHDLVLKVIRDEFPPPKRTTRQSVLDRYQLVFTRDKNGRLVDAQEFEHLTFDRERFDEALLEELLTSAGRTATLRDGQVVIHHAYVERRIVPLDVYIDEADEYASRAAILDYGKAIKELAASNIFPGDMLLKNFGVTRHGRVVFYDYDELCLLTDCKFRRIPQSRHYDDDLSDEPWFSVGENDIFPEEFESFWGLPGSLKLSFRSQHADLFGAEFWQGMQTRIQNGEIIHISPYKPALRLHREWEE